MDIKVIDYKRIHEKLYIYEHKSGLKAFVIPKKGYNKKYATFSTHYGSINSEFIIPGESDKIRVPDGIAHFLEHKLFDQKDGSVMDKFSALGSNPNAYTGFSQTVYLFSCTDKFEENLRLLLNFVQNPYLTDESVEKEKGIIGQEIRMYEDDPGWRVFFNLLGAFYKNNPVRIDIAGTVESISKIDKDILYKCHSTFYHPSNMAVLVVGDVDPSRVFALVEENLKASEPKSEIKRIFPQETSELNKDYVEQKLAVSTPLFQAGYRDDRLDTKGIECLKHEIAVKLLLEMLLGKSSRLYNDLYAEGLINSTFDFDYTIEENYAFSMFGGESPDPVKVKDRIAEGVSKIAANGLDKSAYERIKKAMEGRALRQLNSVERISHNFISVYFKGVNLFDYFDVYDKISFEYANGIFREHFNPKKLALSLIKPT